MPVFRRRVVTLLVLLLCTVPLAALGKEQPRFILENAHLRAEFDRQGRLLKLIDLTTGWEIQRRPELARSFQMFAAPPGRRFNPVFGAEQKPPQVVFDRRGQTLIFHWSELKSRFGGTLPVDFQAKVALTEKGLVFRASLRNESKATIETVRWPILGDLSVPRGTRSFAQLGMEYGGMVRLELFPKFDNQPGYFGVDYPTQFLKTPYSPFSLVAADSQGLYVSYHDTTLQQLVEFSAQLRPGYVSYEYWDKGVNPTTDTLSGKPVHLQFEVIHFPFAAPGDSVTIGPVVFQPYKGDWHAGADVYREWRKSWLRPARKPAWLRKVHSWQQIHMNNPEGDVRYRYRDLVTIGRDCARYGVGAIQVTGWSLGGQDSQNPSHDTDPRLGTWQELRDAIARVQRLGVKVVLFAKFTWADRTTAWYRNELVRYATKDPYGDPHVYPGYAYQTATQLADINTHRFVPLCPLCPEWRAVATKEFLKMVALGADGILYDENQHHGGVYYCFDPSHGHHVPANVFAGDALLARGFHKAATEAGRPDFFFGGEGNYDFQFEEYHLSYFRVDLNHVPIHRYVAPDAAMMIAVGGYNDRNMINLALMDRYIISYEPRNFKGRLQEFPLTVRYGQQVDSLRRRYRDYLWDAEFRDTVGATVTESGRPYAHYSVFRDTRTGKRAIVLVNFDYHRNLRLKVRLPGAQPDGLVVVRPEAPDPQPYPGAAELPPNSAAVVLEK